jgi:histidinol-phosphate phosphatase family protein
MSDFSKYRYLLLDRDGVINTERPGDYVKNVSEFQFEEEAPQAIAILNRYYRYIFVVTNQRGVSLGKFTKESLNEVHRFMLARIEESGGKIERIYCNTALYAHNINRKPNTGMAFKIQNDYPEIDFRRCVMAGNSASDIDFACKLQMFPLLIGCKEKENRQTLGKAAMCCNSLMEFALHLQQKYPI